MNRYERVFSTLRDKKEGAFIPFAVAGDPDLEKSEMILRAYIDSGADILEVGYPFSDPVADGPLNQRGARRAIASGLKHSSFFRLMKKIRAVSDIPIGVLLYANSVHHPGYREFCRCAADSGIDSLLVADMPPEEHGPLGREMKECGLARVFIVSELTPPQRMRMICDNTDAFVYVVSRLGTTGVGMTPGEAVKKTLSELKTVTKLPLAVGFGISTAAHVRDVIEAGADAAIVGSALVKVIEDNLENPDSPGGLISKKVREYKNATRTWRRNRKGAHV